MQIILHPIIGNKKQIKKIDRGKRVKEGIRAIALQKVRTLCNKDVRTFLQFPERMALCSKRIRNKKVVQEKLLHGLMEKEKFVII